MDTYCRQRLWLQRRMNNSMKTVFRFQMLMLFALAFIMSGSRVHVFAADKYQQMINCNLHKGTCQKELTTDCRITLDVEPKPVKAMTDLLFRIILSRKLPEGTRLPYIDLGMPGMNMGPNRVILKSTGERAYAGQGIIVRCPSGRKVWRATVVFPDIGQAEFIFHVIY